MKVMWFFDCFVGSGTTAVASKMLGRNFLCADNNEEFVKMAQGRLKDIDTQVTMQSRTAQKLLFVADR